ncbi:hypothetical protein L484_018801 [Morus notabilis]|uniref:Uncharacterized protein n=1 Tax=Morus notabilis TaxID=981085 RepID=W9R4D1_9ROSA|nr:hypothetical protein L484_018801 [Morus notabilis]
MSGASVRYFSGGHPTAFLATVDGFFGDPPMTFPATDRQFFCQSSSKFSNNPPTSFLVTLRLLFQQPSAGQP